MGLLQDRYDLDTRKATLSKEIGDLEALLAEKKKAREGQAKEGESLRAVIIFKAGEMSYTLTCTPDDAVLTNDVGTEVARLTWDPAHSEINVRVTALYDNFRRTYTPRIMSVLDVQALAAAVQMYKEQL